MNKVSMKHLMLLAFSLTLCVFTNAQDAIPKEINTLLTKNICSTCHKLDERLIGPSYTELASKGNSVEEIMQLIAEPQPTNWPDYPPMAPMPFLDEKEVRKMAEWIAGLGIRD